MVTNIDRYFVILGLLFAGTGLGLGELMAKSGDHGQMPTHAHIMLAGWVFSGLYGVIYRLWPVLKTGALPIIHLALHGVGAVLMVVALYLMISGAGDPEKLEIFAIGGSLGVVAGWLLFLIMYLSRAKD